MLGYLGTGCKATTGPLIKPDSYSMREKLVISGLDGEEPETAYTIQLLTNRCGDVP